MNPLFDCHRSEPAPCHCRMQGTVSSGPRPLRPGPRCRSGERPRWRVPRWAGFAPPGNTSAASTLGPEDESARRLRGSSARRVLERTGRAGWQPPGSRMGGFPAWGLQEFPGRSDAGPWRAHGAAGARSELPRGIACATQQIATVQGVVASPRSDLPLSVDCRYHYDASAPVACPAHLHDPPSTICSTRSPWSAPAT